MKLVFTFAIMGFALAAISLAAPNPSTEAEPQSDRRFRGGFGGGGFGGGFGGEGFEGGFGGHDFGGGFHGYADDYGVTMSDYTDEK